MDIFLDEKLTWKAHSIQFQGNLRKLNHIFYHMKQFLNSYHLKKLYKPLYELASLLITCSEQSGCSLCTTRKISAYFTYAQLYKLRIRYEYVMPNLHIITKSVESVAFLSDPWCAQSSCMNDFKKTWQAVLYQTQVHRSWKFKAILKVLNLCTAL